RGSPTSMSIADHSRSWSIVTTVSGESKPAIAVITNAPDALSGGTENARAYASLPRKYRPLRELNRSPSVTPVRRSRDAKSDSALGPRRYAARVPERLPGGRKKIPRLLCDRTVQLL